MFSWGSKSRLSGIAKFIGAGLAVALFASPFVASQSPAQAADTAVDAADVKAQIEAATTDITLELNPGVYDFDMSAGASAQVNNTQAIKVTLVGAVDASGAPATQFTMGDAVVAGPRFIRVDKGTLEVRNIDFEGTSGINGGVSARNVIADNTVFNNNYTNDGVSGGGAIRSAGGTLDINHSTFTNNSTSATSDGGAISSEGSGSIRINDSVFDGNKRVGNQNQYGGAISVKQPGVAGTTIEITNSTFTNNVLTATGNLSTGGAVRIYGNSNLTSVLIDNSLFKANTTTNPLTQNGGAIGFMTTSNSTISNSTFIDNTATKYGGAVYYENSTVNNKIINSTFVGNKASFGGTAVGAYASKVDIDSSTLLSNTLGTFGTGPSISVKDSVLAGTASYASASIVYNGTNLARKTSGEPAVNAADVFTAYTSSTLEQVSPTNYVAPVLVGGPAHEKVDTPRTLNTAQNGVERKSPLSDFGAFEAPQQYTVNFNSNGGSAVEPQSVVSGELVTEPAAPVLEGSIFGGWFTDEGTLASSWDFATGAVSSDMTLFAKWTLVPAPATYHVTYNANTGSGKTPTDSTDYVSGALVKVLAPVSGFAKQGASFNGWNTKANGSGTSYSAGSSFSITADTVLYAQWKNNPLAPCSEPRKIPVFGDVPLTQFFYKEIDWMHCMKYSTGWRQPPAKPVYKPKNKLSREAMAAFIFRMEAPKSYQAPKVSPFADLKQGDPFYREIAWMWEAKVSTGWAEPSGKPTFRPKDELSREAMAAFIYRMETPKNYTAPKKSPMADMKPGMKFYKEISWMYDEGLSTGNKTQRGKEYWPKDKLSREAMAAFIYRLVLDYRANN